MTSCLLGGGQGSGRGSRARGGKGKGRGKGVSARRTATYDMGTVVQMANHLSQGRGSRRSGVVPGAKACFNCQQFGHLKATCTNPKKN